MALPVYLQQFKAAGIYRVVYDQSAIEGVEAEKLRLVVGYSDKGPFNIPTYVKSISEFRTLYGNVSKALERRGVFFHRMALQALSSGPILCLNLKPFTQETVGAYVLKTNDPQIQTTSLPGVKVSDIYDRTRFWELSEEKLAEYVAERNKSAYVSLVATNSKETSVSFVIRKALAAHTRSYDVTVSDWYSDADEMPEYLEGKLDKKMSDFMAEIYVFNTDFSADQINASKTLNKFFDVSGSTVRIKDKIKNAWNEDVDALDALFNEPTSAAIGRYVGSLIPEFRDKQGNYVSLNIIFNKDIDVHNAMMAFNTDMLLDDFESAFNCVYVQAAEENTSESTDVTKLYLGSPVRHLHTGENVKCKKNDKGEYLDEEWTYYENQPSPNAKKYVEGEDIPEGKVVGDYKEPVPYEFVETKDDYAQFNKTYFEQVIKYDAQVYHHVSPVDKHWYEIPEESVDADFHDLPIDPDNPETIISPDTKDHPDKNDSVNFVHTQDTDVKIDKVYYQKDTTDDGFDAVNVKAYLFDKENAYDIAVDDDGYQKIKSNGEYEYVKHEGDFEEGKIYYIKSISYKIAYVSYPKSVKGLYYDKECTKLVEIDTYPTDDKTSYFIKGNLSSINYLEGYDFMNKKPKSSKMSDKLNWHKEILGVLNTEHGLRTGLLSRTTIDYRYIVDTFEAYPERHDMNDEKSTSKEMLSALAKEKENAFAILNFPAIRKFIKDGINYVTNNAFNFDKIVSGETQYGLPSELNGASFCAFYTPLKFSDGYIDTIIPSAALVSNLFMQKYNSRQPYYIVAGPNYGSINAAGLVGPDYNYSKEELNLIEPFGVNCMVYRPGFGTFINANQTAKQTPKSALSSVNVRELVIYLQDEIEKVLQAYQWEFNNENTRNAILDKANQICARVAGNGGIQVYKNVMDTSNNTTEVIDNEMAILSTHIEPGRGCGKMVQELTIYRTGQLSSNITEY